MSLLSLACSPAPAVRPSLPPSLPCSVPHSSNYYRLVAHTLAQRVTKNWDGKREQRRERERGASALVITTVIIKQRKSN